MRNQPLRFSFEGKDYFIQFAYKKDQKAWDESAAKNSKWTPKLLKAINEAVEAIVNSDSGLRHLPPVLFSDLEEAPKLTHSNVAICEILRGNVGDSTKEMVTWFKGKTYRAVMDNFNKETARNHALEHALKDANAFEGLAKENGIDLSAAERYVGGEQDKAFISLISRFRFAAWEAYNHRKDLHCAECGKTGVRTVWKIEEVPVAMPEPVLGPGEGCKSEPTIIRSISLCGNARPVAFNGLIKRPRKSERLLSRNSKSPLLQRRSTLQKLSRGLRRVAESFKPAT